MHLEGGFHTYYIYILTNKAKSVFYTGVTNDLRTRLSQHKNNILVQNKTFASKYHVEFLLYYENLPGFKKLLQEKKK